MTNNKVRMRESGSYAAIFFDLDHTLWDYETSSRETLHELYTDNRLESLGIARFESFYEVFREVNFQLWDLYDHGKLDSGVIRKERFKMILERLDAFDSDLSDRLSHDYLNNCPRKGYLVPGAIETLDYLSGRYSLTIITNGFEDIQRIKLESGKITSYFDHIVTSQKAGHKKPAREIFDYALASNGITSNEAVMVGDNLSTDVAGARNASIDMILFNPERMEHKAQVKHEINRLEELCTLL